MDLPQLISAAPNLAFGIICLWFVREIQKERLAESARYAESLARINELYVQLLEKVVTAIANNAALSSRNGDTLARVDTQLSLVAVAIGRLHDAVERIGRDSKRGQSNYRGSPGGPGSGG